MILGLLVQFSDEVIEKAVSNVRAAMESGRLIYETYIPEFERRVAEMCGMPKAEMFCSDTAAQECLFDTLGFASKKIVVQGNIFSSPVFAMQRQGLEVLWCDIDPRTADICLENLRRILDTHEVAAVHVSSSGGAVIQHKNELCSMCEDYGVILIEDAAHSFGSRRGEVVSGGYADFSVFCFCATKMMGFGVGGLLTGKHQEIVENANVLARYGRRPRFGSAPSEIKGYSYRMSEIPAAVGCAILDDIPRVTRIKAKLAAKYVQGLQGIKGLHLYDYGQSNFYKFPVLFTNGTDREGFRKYMTDNGIQLSANCSDIPTYRQLAFGSEFAGVSLKGCEEYCLNHICLPMHEWLSEAQVEMVCSKVLEYMEKTK